MSEDIRIKLKNSGLKITPQRIAVLQAVVGSNHPTVEQISNKVKKQHASIATGTIYKILEVFVNIGIIRKIDTQSDVMRYDAILDAHHHLQDENGALIEDYFDDELLQLVKDHLANKEIPGFEISDVKIQIVGKFNSIKPQS